MMTLIGPCGVGFIGNIVGPDLLILLAPLMMIFWVWMLVEAATKEPAMGNDRVVWVLVIVLGQVLGAAIYYFVRRPERIKKYGQ